MEALDEATHNKVMDLFRKYLLVGGLPDAVNTYLAEKTYPDCAGDPAGDP